MHPLVARLNEYMKALGINTRKLSIDLGYDQPEKLYRLFRDKNAKPSIDIIEDISNKFDDLNLQWLLTGKGEMLIKQGNTPLSSPGFNLDNPDFQALSLHLKGGTVPENVPPTVPPPPKNTKKTGKTYPLDTPQTGSYVAEDSPVYNLGLPRIITINERQEENIIYVPVKARAGYLSGYGDADFMHTLPTYRLPGLDNATYRMFETEGPSMAPNIISGDKVIGQWVQTMDDIRENRVHVVVTKNDGVVVKRLMNRIHERGKIVLKSDTVNHRKEFPTYQIDPSDVLEIWYCRLKLSSDFSEPSEVYHRINDLESDMTEVKAILDIMLKK